jgi:hypothetical protein
MTRPGTVQFPSRVDQAAEEEQPARTPQTVVYRFWITWEEDTPQGPRQQFSKMREMRNVQIALSEHAEACKGLWVRRGMHKPYVSELKILVDGSMRDEERRPKKLLPEFGEVSP